MVKCQDIDYSTFNSQRSNVKTLIIQYSTVNGQIDSSAQSSKPKTLFVPTRPAYSKISGNLLDLKNTLTGFEKKIKEYTSTKPRDLPEACFEHTKKCFEERVINYVNMFQLYVMYFELNYSDEAKEFKRIYDELAVEYANRLRYHQYLSAVNEKIYVQNKRLRIQRKNLLLKNDELITADLAKEV
nr:hypothetical protein [Tanacetum cinerariifolium]